MAKRIKVKPVHRRDFATYLRWRREWKGAFNPTPAERLQRGGSDALQAFVRCEATGQRPEKVQQPLIYQAVTEGKALLNWQIKQWSDGIRDAGLINAGVAFASLLELIEAEPWLPKWVWVATWRQAGYRAESL